MASRTFGWMGHVAAALFLLFLLVDSAFADGFQGLSFEAPSPDAEWEVDPSANEPWVRGRLRRGESTITFTYEPLPEDPDTEAYVRAPFEARGRMYKEVASASFRTARGRTGFVLEYAEPKGKRRFAQAAVLLKHGMVTATLASPSESAYDEDRPGFLAMCKGIRKR